MLTRDQIKRLSNREKDWIVDGILDNLDYMDKFEINTPLRKAHFLAQLAHESDGLKTTKEYGGPGKRYAPWYGRGLIQVTWKDNYEDFYAWCKLEGLDPPNFLSVKGREEVANFPWAFLGAVWYWNAHGLNRFADQDDIRTITKRINGGYNGLEDRMHYLDVAKEVLGVGKRPIDGKPGTITTTHSVKDVQRALNVFGYGLEEDGIIGRRTINALKDFQNEHGLVPDGVLGPKTEAMLFNA